MRGCHGWAVWGGNSRRQCVYNNVCPTLKDHWVGALFVVFWLFMVQAFCVANSMQSQNIDSILRSAGLESADIPGAAILVIKGGQIVFERGYGVTDLKRLHKIDARTNFRLASVTKQFTAMAIMLLVHDSKLRYDERLTAVLPDFPEYGRAITIRMLLNHTSGLLDYEDLMPPVDARLPVEQNQIQDAGILDLLKHQNSTRFPPGSKWAYSNSGYVLLGMVVAKISHESFPDFLRDRLFTPLGMNSTVAYVRGKNAVSYRAFGHMLENGTWKQVDQSPTSATLGDGGVYSSLEDLAKWDRALRNNSLLGPGEMQPALTPVNVPGVAEPDGRAAQYGFGWFLNPYKSHQRMWHYGETIGFRSVIQRFTNDNVTVIILCNRADLNPSPLALQIADSYLEPTAKP
jgi:CubicO group peptidase (beta-lactamase class C family)